MLISEVGMDRVEEVGCIYVGFRVGYRCAIQSKFVNIPLAVSRYCVSDPGPADTRFFGRRVMPRCSDVCF